MASFGRWKKGDVLEVGLENSTSKVGDPVVVQHYLPRLLQRIENGDIDPTFVITHRASLKEQPRTLQDLPRQAPRLHQGGPETVTPPWPAF
jgi:hypothetical protein